MDRASHHHAEATEFIGGLDGEVALHHDFSGEQQAADIEGFAWTSEACVGTGAAELFHHIFCGHGPTVTGASG